jgi:hypothetical protein
MNLRTLAILSSVALLAPVFASDARAQRPGSGPPVYQPPAVYQPGYDRDNTRTNPDRARVQQYEVARTRERQRLGELAFREGYEAGVQAVRDRRPFDLSRESRYRSADRRYDRDFFGPKEIYRSFYRDAFSSGYERAYREGRRYDPRDQTPWLR